MSSEVLASSWENVHGRGILSHTPVLCGTVLWVKISWLTSQPTKTTKILPSEKYPLYGICGSRSNGSSIIDTIYPSHIIIVSMVASIDSKMIGCASCGGNGRIQTVLAGCPFGCLLMRTSLTIGESEVFGSVRLHVHLGVMHALSSIGHLYDCACVRRGPSHSTGL